jgi:hypothetical protein
MELDDGTRLVWTRCHSRVPPDNTIADTGQQITCRACLRTTAAERILSIPMLAFGPPREAI